MANKVGLCDMVGNVSELVLACGHVIGDSVRLPPDGSPEVPGGCEKFTVALGSNWYSGMYDYWGYRAWQRIHAKPIRKGNYYWKTSTTWAGFRVVRELEN